MILVVGAMVEELKEIIHSEKLKKVVGSPFNEYQNADQSIVVCATGIGTVNAAAGLTYLLTKYQKVESVLVLGTAGALGDTLKQGDLVLIEKAIYANVDVRVFGYQLGQIPKMPVYYQADEHLLTQAQQLLKAQNYASEIINTVSLDVFVEQIQQVDQLIKPLPLKTQIAEMEIASYYQVATLFQTPILAIKIISDILISPQASKTEFDQFLPLAALQLRKVFTCLMVKKQNSKE